MGDAAALGDLGFGYAGYLILRIGVLLVLVLIPGSERSQNACLNSWRYKYILGGFSALICSRLQIYLSRLNGGNGNSHHTVTFMAHLGCKGCAAFRGAYVWLYLLEVIEIGNEVVTSPMCFRALVVRYTVCIRRVDPVYLVG